jgi:hypothetical protein
VDPVGAFESNDPRQFNRYVYAANNPYRYRDPDGRIIETVWDLANVALGAKSLSSNFSKGDYSGAAVDAIGLLTDVAASALPGVPGGAGAAIRLARGSDNALDTAKLAGFVQERLAPAHSAAQGLRLEKSLASESQTARILAGEGVAIAGAGSNVPLRDAQRLAAQYGGRAADWSKVTGGNHIAKDGTKIETHAYQNLASGYIVEPKTKLFDEQR